MPAWLDMLASVGALAGLVGVGLGYRWADPVAGLVVTLFIVHVGYDVTSTMVHHLMDGVEPEYLETAAAAARAVPGVHEATVRGRWMGRSLVLEVEGQIDAVTSVGDAAAVGDAVQVALYEAIDQVRQVRWIPRPVPPTA